MPGNLESSLAGIPIYRAALAQQQFDQQQQTGALANLLRQQQLSQSQGAQREEEEIRQKLSSPEVAGDPHKAIKALLASGTPKAVELATKLMGMLPKPGLQQIGTGLYDPQTEKTVAPPARPGAEIAGQPEIIKLQKFAESLPPGHPGRRKIEGRIQLLSTRPDKAQNRPLPSPLQKQLTEIADLADATERFDSTFQDSYGGKTITGELSNVKGKYFGDDTGQSQWWQDYELHQSQVRNKLFGSALTAPEIAAWEKSAINPRMEPKQIRANLARRKELEQRAINRLMRGAAVTYNKEQIEAFTGRTIPSGGQPERRSAPRQSTKRVVVDY